MFEGTKIWKAAPALVGVVAAGNLNALPVDAQQVNTNNGSQLTVQGKEMCQNWNESMAAWRARLDVLKGNAEAAEKEITEINNKNSQSYNREERMRELDLAYKLWRVEENLAEYNIMITKETNFNDPQIQKTLQEFIADPEQNIRGLSLPQLIEALKEYSSLREIADTVDQGFYLSKWQVTGYKLVNQLDAKKVEETLEKMKYNSANLCRAQI